MKLSEAMREGARKRPQAYGRYYHYDLMGKGWQIASCAWGAAAEGVTGQAPRIIERPTYRDDPTGTGIRHPATNMRQFFREAFGVGDRLFREVCFMNDQERMSRDEIADYLEEQGL
jgi:hypothetical protein